MKTLARVLLVAAAVVFYLGLSLYAGRSTRRSLSPFPPMPATGTAVMEFAVVVLLPAAAVAYVVAARQRIAERLGVLPPDDPPDEG